MYLLNGKKLPLGVSFMIGDIRFPPNWLQLSTDVERDVLGIVEELDQVRPQPEDHYFITIDANGLEEYTLKSQAQINEVENAKILQQITQMEAAEFLKRGIREALIEFAEDKAIAMGAAASSNFTLAQFSQVTVYIGIVLTQAQQDAVALGNVPPLDPAQSLEIAYAFNIAYRNYKDFDNQIAALRAQLIK